MRQRLEMTAFRSSLGLFLLAALLVGAAAPRPVEAHGRVFVGIGPVYLYPYYSPPPVYYPVAPPWGLEPDIVPPGWVPGHWERHHDRTGRPYDVWVPPHLR